MAASGTAAKASRQAGTAGQAAAAAHFFGHLLLQFAGAGGAPGQVACRAASQANSWRRRAAQPGKQSRQGGSRQQRAAPVRGAALSPEKLKKSSISTRPAVGKRWRGFQRAASMRCPCRPTAAQQQRSSRARGFAHIPGSRGAHSMPTYEQGARRGVSPSPLICKEHPAPLATMPPSRAAGARPLPPLWRRWWCRCSVAAGPASVA